MSIKNDLLLYAVTAEDTTLSQACSALDGGATMLQLRRKNAAEDEFAESAAEFKLLCSEKNVPFIINDDVRLAVLSGADGVHIGQSDGDVQRVRTVIGKDMLLGVSAQTVEQAVKAEKEGADYLGVGAVFHTDTKSDADYVTYDVLKDICASVEIPVVAIGGITADNISTLKGSGIAGAAVVSALFSAPDIKAATENMLQKINEVTGN